MSLSFIDVIFLGYMFVGLYMLSLLVFIYYPKRKEIFDYPKADPVPVSIIVPCYNEEKSIANTLNSLLNLDYPKDLIEIIVVDDKSKDNSVSIVKEFTKKYKNISLIVNEKNSGGAAEPTNLGIKASKYDYIVLTDGDSTPEPDALKKMIGFLKEKDVAAVTCSVLSKNPSGKFIQRLQAVEYLTIAFGRKLFDFIDCVYVTPGPFALYKKNALLEVGLFDKSNMTQDIEIVWRLIAHGYKARMSLSAKVYSETPNKFRSWWKQRIRWNIGGTQCIIKHRKQLFKKNMLGYFIIPFFSLSMFLGLFGLGIFLYLIITRAIFYYLSTTYSIYAQTAVLTFQDLTFAPSILNFLGAAMFLMGAAYTMIIISIMNESKIKNKNLFNLLFYLTIYLTIYPFIMVHSLYKLITGKYSW